MYEMFITLYTSQKEPQIISIWVSLCLSADGNLSVGEWGFGYECEVVYL
jgi:hypothetical protein